MTGAIHATRSAVIKPGMEASTAYAKCVDKVVARRLFTNSSEFHAYVLHSSGTCMLLQYRASSSASCSCCNLALGPFGPCSGQSLASSRSTSIRWHWHSGSSSIRAPSPSTLKRNASLACSRLRATRDARASTQPRLRVGYSQSSPFSCRWNISPSVLDASLISSNSLQST